MDNTSIFESLPTPIELPSTSILDSKRLSVYIAISILLLVAWFLQPSKEVGAIGAPFYKASKTKWIFDAETLIKDSYSKFQDKVYQIRATEGIQVLLPAKYVGEVKALPEDVLSATEAMADALQSRYTKFSAGHNGDLLTLLLRTKLTQNLTRLLPGLRDELQHFLATEFPACDDWTAVTWQPLALRAVARLSGRAFVGSDLNRREEWMHTSINFAVNVFMACVKLQFFPEWARPVAQYLVWDLGRIRRDIERAKELLRPILEGRLRDREAGVSGDDAPDDLLQWFIEALPEEEKADVQTQAELQLIVAAASIHTTNNLLCECMYDLAADPQIQEELRQEAYQVLGLEGGWETKEGLAKLHKLDSFIREVQRLRGNITSFIRKVMKPISLSDGTHLPAGTKVLAPQAGISHDERYFPCADTFDPLRFYRMRQGDGAGGTRWQLTSPSDTNIHFGAGRHACPGRFFASCAIKLVLAHLLLGFEVRLREGEARPVPMAMVMVKSPSTTAKLEFRRRSMRE